MRSPEDIALLENINLPVTVFSVLGSLYMICLCLRSPGQRTVSLNLILAIGISDFVYSISNIMESFDNNSSQAFCATEALLRVWSFNFSVFWTACIPLLFYKTSIADKPFNQNRFFRHAAVYGTLWCILLSILPFFTDRIVYSRSALNCWIMHNPNTQDKEFKVFVRMLYQGGILFLGIIITLAGYIWAIRRINKLPQVYVEHMGLNPYKLLIYPCVLCFTFGPAVIDNIYEIYYPNGPLWIKIVHIILTHSIGFINAIVYGTQRKNLRSGGNYETPTYDTSLFEPSVEAEMSGSYIDELIIANQAH